MRTAPLLSSLLVVAAACGGPDDKPMIIPQPDAPTDAAKACGAQADYGTPPPAMEIASRDLDVNPTVLFYDAAINADPKFDDLSIQLFKGLGTFETGELTPRNVALSGPENNYETCGACVLLYIDLDPENDYADDGVYMIDGGTLEITSITPNLTGRISNASFVHVTIDPDTYRSTPVGDCSSTMASFSFDFPVTTDTGMAVAPSPSRAPRLRKPGR